MVKKSRKKYAYKIADVAAILAVIASLFAAVCWITSGKAGGAADDKKTAALGMITLYSTAKTDESNALVRIETYRMQADTAAVYWDYAIKENNENAALYWENKWYESNAYVNYYILYAENEENKAQMYYDEHENALDLANNLDKAAGNRSTGALVFNVAVVLAECTVLIKRKEPLYVFIPIFAIGMYYLIVSLF